MKIGKWTVFSNYIAGEIMYIVDGIFKLYRRRDYVYSRQTA